MLKWPVHLAAFCLALMPLMSFKIVSKQNDSALLHYDVRSAFVTSRSDIPADLMQRVHHHLATAIQQVSHSQFLPRVILAVRITPITYTDLVIGKRASAVVKVSATAVSTGEIVATAQFRANALGFSTHTALVQLADGISRQVIREFKLVPEQASTLVNALTPVNAH